MNRDIADYNQRQIGERHRICEQLMRELEAGLPDADHKIWHAHPTWFLDGNPIVAYNALKDSIRLLFWSGQSFEESGLQASGTFKAAEVRYTHADQIQSEELQRWLEKARDIQWDYQNIRRNQGSLMRKTRESR